MIKEMASEERRFVLPEISYGGQGFQVRLHAALGFFITLLVTLLGVKYQQDPVSPFDANPMHMMAFMGFLSLYVPGLMAMGRGGAVALLLWHVSFISGLFASGSLLLLVFPASFGCILMVSSALLLLITAPCKPMGLFYSKIQHRLCRQAQASNQSEEPDANTPDLERNLHPASTAPTGKDLLSDIHGSNGEVDQSSKDDQYPASSSTSSLPTSSSINKNDSGMDSSNQCYLFHSFHGGLELRPGQSVDIDATQGWSGPF